MARNLWIHRCAGGCGEPVLEDGAARLAFCGACWFVEKTCASEGAVDLAELAARRYERDMLLAEISRAVRASGIASAERLIQQVERRLS